MSLHLHRAPRTDLLADALGDLLAVPLGDPFASEVVVVPAKGVERWLTQRLAHRLGGTDGGSTGSSEADGGGDGVCAGVRFLRPTSLVALLTGRDHDDPWEPDRLVWPLLATVDDSLGEPWCAALSAHLGHGRTGAQAELRRDRRYSVAIRLARLFAAYAAQRPTLVADWRAGRDDDGAGRPLDPDLRWQPELWRRLMARVEADPPDIRHDRTLAALRCGSTGLDLPDRLSLFGHTRLATSEVELLHAVGHDRDVHLWLPQPSSALWTALAGLGGVVPRDDDTSGELVGHPLLASLGRDARELRRTLESGGFADRPVTGSAPAGSAAVGATGQPDTLLGWLQHDLRANQVPDDAERLRRRCGPDDRSVQVHACHGAARQVDVLREVLVGLLQDDPTLEPRDIVVMCPDIEAFAPLVSAGFGLAPGESGAPVPAGGHPGHRLRVRLADRALTSTNPLLGTAATLLDLAGGRVTASDVLDLASTAPCRSRFGFTDDDLERVGRWVRTAQVRWGLDAESRAPFAMQGFADNTWRSGLDRVLLGVTMSGDDHRHLGRGLPLDDVGSSEIDLAGRLAELVDRLAGCLSALATAVTVSDWMTALAAGVRDLTEVRGDEAWQLPQLERELARAAALDELPADGTNGTDGPDGTDGVTGVRSRLRLADVRALLDQRLAGRPTRANFRTGTLTVCTMTPMRSVPHRVLCMVGLDDGVFPRRGGVDGDDVLLRGPLTGERDVRSEDRQLFLDAILAATDHLVVTYTGADQQSGAHRPPAVPLGELLDALDRTTAAPVRDDVLTRHPLQAYDPRNLKPPLSAAASLSTAAPDQPPDQPPDPPEWADPALRGPTQRPFSFDRSALSGARSAVGVRHRPPPLLESPLPRRSVDDVSLADLKAFLARPARAFLRGRLDVAPPYAADELGDAIPVDLDALELWQVGDHLLSELLAGQDPVAVMTAEQLGGRLPPGLLGHASLHDVAHECQQLWNRTAEVREQPARSVDVSVDLGPGRRLTGTVTAVHGSRVVSLGYSRLKPRQRLLTWVDVLALSASGEETSWTGHAIGRERAGPKRALSGPLDERATTWLRALVELRDLGLTRPLPVPVATAAAWAEARARELAGQDVSPVDAARRAWQTDPHHPLGITGEDAEPVHELVFGVGAPLERLLDDGLPELAWQIWEPLLAGAERVAPL